MNNYKQDGFKIWPAIYSKEEIATILAIIGQSHSDKPTFRKTADLFAIRQVLKEIPSLAQLIFNEKMKSLISETFGDGYFVSKSIYFDKPANSNWFVAYHQDLTISVTEKVMVPGYGLFTRKQDQFAVQPPLSILENNFTLRIHLDVTNEENGALRVIPGSHLKGIRRTDQINWNEEKEVVCNVPEGGVMLMHPLIFHASGRSTGSFKRRVIHIEFSNQHLPEVLHWAERFDFN